MDFVKREVKILSSIILGCFLVLFLLIPLLHTIFQLGLQFSLSEVGADFLGILLHSMYFTLKVYFMLFLVCGLIVLLFLYMLLNDCFTNIDFALLKALSLFYFVLPGASISLLMLLVVKSFLNVSLFGLWGVVFVMIYSYAAYVSVQILLKLRDWFMGEGRNLLQCAQIMGLKGFQLYYEVCRDIIFKCYKEYGPILFSWVFFSFSIVLIVSGDPKLSTPEILLFYHLKGFMNPSRILVLIMLQILLSFVLSRYVKSNNILSVAPNLTDLQPKRLQLKNSNQNVACYLLKWAIILFFVFPAIFVLLRASPVDFLMGLVSLKDAFVNSFLIFFSTIFLCTILLILLWLSHDKLLYILVSLWPLSPTLYLALWGESHWIYSLETFSAKAMLASIFYSLLFLPFLSSEVLSQKKTISVDEINLLSSLGASEKSYWKYLCLPRFKEFFILFSKISFFFVCGELALSSLVFSEYSLVPLELSRAAARYDFSKGQILLILFLMVSLFQFIFDFLKINRRQTLRYN